MKGVNGSKVVGFQVKTRIRFYDLSKEEKENSIFEPCLVITTKTKEAAEALLELFPKGSKYKNVLIHVEYLGKVSG